MHRSGFCRVALLSGAVAVFLGIIPPSLSIAEPQERETFRALAQSVAAGISGQTAILIQISRWSTQEEADHLANVVLEEDMDRLFDELQKQEEVGRIRIPGEVGTAWPLRYAEEYREDGKRYILLAADRPIDFWEAVDRPMRTWQYRTTLIELVLDENNPGEGAMAVGAALTIDPEQGTLNVKHMTTTGVRLTNVRK